MNSDENFALFELMAKSDIGTAAVKMAADDLVRSSEELLEAAKLAADDEIKIQMVEHLRHDFEILVEREDALHQSMTISYNRKFVVEEMLEIAAMNRNLAAKIKEKLQDIAGHKHTT